MSDDRRPLIYLHTKDGKPVLGADYYEILAGRLKQMRKERGWTAAEFADRLGLSKDRLRILENHRGQPTIPELLRICQELDVSPNWFLYGSDSLNYAKHVQANLITKRGEIDTTKQLIRMSLFFSLLSPHERSALGIVLTSMLRGSHRTDEEIEAIHRTADSLAIAFSHNPFLDETIRRLAQDPELLPRIEAELARERAEKTPPADTE